MYDLPKFNSKNTSKLFDNKIFQGVLLALLIFVGVIFYLSLISGNFYSQMYAISQRVEDVFSVHPSSVESLHPAPKYVSEISYEQAVIDSVKEASPSVVSIIISK